MKQHECHNRVAVGSGDVSADIRNVQCGPGPRRRQSRAINEREPLWEKTAFIISRIDAAAAEEFQKAWRATRNGYDGFEGLVLVYKEQDGSISARSRGKSEEQHRFTFGWTADIIAVVHTHANVDKPTPSELDLKVADRFRVPVFTLTRRGMYVYDPETRKISIVQNGLDWLRSSKWNSRGGSPGLK